jgi:hypothetical protein
VTDFPSVKRSIISHLFSPAELQQLKAANLNEVSRRVGNLCTQPSDRYLLQVRAILLQVFLATQAPVEKKAEFFELQKELYRVSLRLGADVLTKIWKELTNAYQRFAFRSIISKDETTWETALDVISDEGKRIYQMLVRIEPSFADSPEEPTLRELWRVSTMAQTRNMPAPAKPTVQEKVFDYIKSMCESDPSIEEERKCARRIGKMVGRQVSLTLESNRNRKYGAQFINDSAHLSLSAGSCWEATRSQGGKWSVLAEDSDFLDFLKSPVEHWATLEPDLNCWVDTYGNRVCLYEKAGLETWRISYVTALSGPDEPATLSEVGISGELGDVIPQWEALQDFLGNGVDNRFGKLIHAWTCQKRDEFEQSEQNLNAKLVTITEPGCKVRPLTSGEAWAYLYMVPAAHYLTDALAILPQTSQGLKGSSGLWRFGQSLSKHWVMKHLQQKIAKRNSQEEKIQQENAEETFRREGPDYISTSDLTAATDNANRDISREMIKGFVSELPGTPSGMKKYMNKAVDLLCSDRNVSYRCTRKESAKICSANPGATRKRVAESTGKANQKNWLVQCTFRRGILMGDAICKVVLSLASVGAYFVAANGGETMLDFTPSFHSVVTSAVGLVQTPVGSQFACAGDDHTATGRPEYLTRIPVILESMHYQISWEKYFISKKYVSYCQEFGITPKKRISIHVDVPRLRLISQFVKGGTHSQFEQPDPLWGKAKTLGKNILFMREQGFSDLSTQEESDYLIEMMERLIPLALRLNVPKFFEFSVAKNMLTYLPTDFKTDDDPNWRRLSNGSFQGGPIGVPSRFDWKTDVQVLQYISDRVAQVIYPEQLTTPRGGQKTIWERGIECTMRIDGLSMDLVGQGLELFNGREVRAMTIESLDSESGKSSAGGSANWAIIKRAEKDFVRIDAPEDIVRTKELPYTLMMREGVRSEQMQTVQPKRRTGCQLRSIQRSVRKRLPQVTQLMGESENLPLDAGGLLEPAGFVDINRGQLYRYAYRDKVMELYGIQQWSPDLKLKKRFFGGKYEGIVLEGFEEPEIIPDPGLGGQALNARSLDMI